MQRLYIMYRHTSMTQKFKDKYRVASTRLPNRDYSANGWYFVTICTHQKLCFFGDAIAGGIQLSEIGKIAQKFWAEIPSHFHNTYLDAYIIMPNHVHGIVVIDRSPCRDVACNVSTEVPTQANNFAEYDVSRAMSEMSPKAGSLSAIVRSYKAAVSRWCRMNSYLSFAWQPRFYDHIIRADGSLDRIREYIVNNPTKWELDKNNPSNLWM